MTGESFEQKPPLATEMWFREDEEPLLRARTITATGRLGDRTPETRDPKGGYQEGQPIVVKIQRADKSFSPEEIAVTPNAVIKKISHEITSGDLAGTSFEGRTVAEFIAKLESIYGRKIDGNETITIVHFQYDNQ